MDELKLTTYVDRNNTASAASLIAAKYVDDNFSVNNIETLNYEKDIVSSPFVIYNSKILYFLEKLHILGRGPFTAIIPTITFYDELNVEKFRVSEYSNFYDGLLAVNNYTAMSIIMEHLWFFRISSIKYEDINFKGYKLTLD